MNTRLLAVLMMIFATSAFAEDSGGRYMTYSDTTCGAYIEERKNTKGVPYNQTAFWVGGYISAYNRMASDTNDLIASTDMDGVLLWLENYCRNNPLARLSAGMVNLTRELHPKRRREGFR